MRRISYWFLCTVSAVVLLVGFDASRHGGSVSGTAETPFSSSVSSGTTSGSTAGDSTTKKTHKTGKSGSTKKSSSATVTGSVAQTQWGPVQVQLVVTAGKVTTVNVLQYPNGNSRDGEINSYALPILVKETLSAQSASIDMVSGATYTSQGYLQSLQSALDQANL